MGGVGSAPTQALVDADVTTPIRVHGVAQEFLDHAKSKVILEWIGVTPETTVADTIAHAPRNALRFAQLVVLCAPARNNPRSAR
jgi:1-deoxy-D-xylulose-5-phosphate synthase